VIKKIMKAISDALNFDPTGQVSLVIDLSKEAIRKINQAIEDVANAVESVLQWVFFAQEIVNLINWIRSLPEKIKKLLLACIANFTDSLKQAVESIKSIPEQIADATAAQAKQIAEEFIGAAQELEDAAKIQFDNDSQNIPSGLLDFVTNPSEDSANNFITYISENTPNANAVFANSTVSLMENSSSP